MGWGEITVEDGVGDQSAGVDGETVVRYCDGRTIAVTQR